MSAASIFIPYPPPEKHGLIGDRRTAALVAADGTLDWLCLPNYDGASVFGALLDARRGGFWRLGPVRPVFGRQHYHAETAILITRWESQDWALELTDAMVWPEAARPPAEAPRRTILRRLRCDKGEALCGMLLRPRVDFSADARVLPIAQGASLELGDIALGFWSSLPVETRSDCASAEFALRAGDEAWFVLGPDEASRGWSVDAARTALEATSDYWETWSRRTVFTGPRANRIRRCALTIHQLSFAPSGAVIAAPTTSLPERIGGDRNYDYRFAWVRDASLSLAALALLGHLDEATRYMDWMAGLDSAAEMPLQVLYRIDGTSRASEEERRGIAGYRQSTPVRFGNHAFEQVQLDSLGYLADCALIYLQQGGAWKPQYARLMRSLVDCVLQRWRETDNGIWELGTKQHYVSGKVMAWVTLDRAVKISEHFGEADACAQLRAAMEEIHGDVMARGWSERQQCFRQRYEDETALDASVLLIPLMGFLPADHRRVIATVDRIAADLALDGMLYRFDSGCALPRPDPSAPPLGEYETAFLPCTLWLAAAYAMIGRVEEAEAILARVDRVAGELGLLAEELDPRTDTFLGNTPLLFSHAEYLRAVLEIAKARLSTKVTMMVGQGVSRLQRYFSEDAG